MSPEEIIRTYGYWGLLGGALLEGETVVLLAGFAAHQGYLDLRYVIPIAFAGSLAGDQFWFAVGRFKGRAILQRLPWLARKAQRVDELLGRFHTLLVLSFRFIYGMRTVVPLVLATGRIGRLRFAVLNAIGAAIWSIVIPLAGYFFGAALELALGRLKRYERPLMIGILVAGLLAALTHQVISLYRRRRQTRRNDESVDR
jgi:membrane protein DedA with SNARE-associated domain